MEGRWRNIENCCSLTLTRDVTTGLSKRPLRNNRSVSSATLPSSSRLSRTCMKAAGTVTRHFSITPCYLVVREGQRHCRHERRREGVKATRGDAGCGHSPDQYWDTATGGWSTRHFVGNGGDGFLNINFTMENSLDDRKFFVYRFVKITRRNKKLCNKKEEEKKLWSKILIYVQIDICRINELVDRNSGNVSLKIWIIIRYYECNFTPRSYYVLPSYI